MNILTLFNGGGGVIDALEAADIPIDTIYSSEFDDTKNALFHRRYGGKYNIVDFGDVKNVSKDKIKDKIDFCIAGSPCQDNSSLGNASGTRNFLDGDKSSLFWEVPRILKEINPTYAMLENVRGLPPLALRALQEVMPDMNRYNVDSKYHGPIKRNRVYLTNIPLKDVYKNEWKKTKTGYLYAPSDPTDYEALGQYIFSSSLREGETLDDVKKRFKEEGLPDDKELWRLTKKFGSTVPAGYGNLQAYEKSLANEFKLNFGSGPVLVKPDSSGNFYYHPEGEFIDDPDLNVHQRYYRSRKDGSIRDINGTLIKQDNTSMPVDTPMIARPLTDSELEITHGYPVGSLQNLYKTDHAYTNAYGERVVGPVAATIGDGFNLETMKFLLRGMLDDDKTVSDERLKLLVANSFKKRNNHLKVKSRFD